MKHVEIRSNNGWSGAYAVRRFEEGDLVMRLDGEERTEPNRYSIQIAEGVHLHPSNGGWKFLNHSCRPNLSYVHEPRAFKALETISEGDELSFNYLTTEWDMAQAFPCHCGSPRCYGRIAGFKHLPPHAQQLILPHAAPHIQRLFTRSLVDG